MDAREGGENLSGAWLRSDAEAIMAGRANEDDRFFLSRVLAARSGRVSHATDCQMLVGLRETTTSAR